MTVKEQMALIADASDRGDRHAGIYQPAVMKVSRRKNGDTQVTLGFVTNDFSVEDIGMRPIVLWMAVATPDAIKKSELALAADKEQAEMARTKNPPAEPTCFWREDEPSGAWRSSCNDTAKPTDSRMFDFEYDGPKENHFEFCPYCGRKLSAAPSGETS